MENTGKFLSEDDPKPQWFLAVGERSVGPLTSVEVFERIQAQEITWAHFVWRAGQTDWARICDIAVFQSAVPSKPKLKAEPEVKKTPPRTKDSPQKAESKPAMQDRLWFLYYNDAQFGPFSYEEVGRFLRVGKIHSRVYAWRDGMIDWEKLEKLVEFEEAVSENKKVRIQMGQNDQTGRVTLPGSQKEEKKDQRKAPRRPLVARVFMTNEEDAHVTAAVCRDISIGGMQVLTDRVPGIIGTKIKMNVSPSTDGKGDKFRPFVAQGVIVRILEDGRGFSFRFESLKPDAKRAIEDYIGQTG